MPTTIQVKDRTRRELEELKVRMNASSLDEVVSTLAEEKLGAPRSLFGKVKGLRGDVREHKDRTDRY